MIEKKFKNLFCSTSYLLLYIHQRVLLRTMAPVSRSTKASSSKTKPYDKSITTLSSVKESLSSNGKSVAPARGAPAQLKQTSRKGKKAWRKNVDITAEEEALELAREEERVTG